MSAGRHSLTLRVGADIEFRLTVYDEHPGKMDVAIDSGAPGEIVTRVMLTLSEEQTGMLKRWIGCLQ